MYIHYILYLTTPIYTLYTHPLYIVGTFLYADGGIFLRLSAAADAVTKAICVARPDTAMISLCSPTEVFTVPAEASEAANNRYESFTLHTPWERAVGSLSGNRYVNLSYSIPFIPFYYTCITLYAPMYTRLYMYMQPYTHITHL